MNLAHTVTYQTPTIPSKYSPRSTGWAVSPKKGIKGLHLPLSKNSGVPLLHSCSSVP